MTYKILLFILSLISNGTAHADIPWWLRPTVCRISPTDCYTAMGAGFDTEMWDATSSCWGMKYICADALTNSNTATLMGRAEIARGTGINSDFDTNLLGIDGDCFGRRKTEQNGAIAIINGKPVKVWCNGILDNADEEVANGEISLTTQPTCQTLANNGYVGVINNNCYGKYFDDAKYYIDCSSGLEPERIIILNNADYDADGTDAPQTQSDADEHFEKMYNASKKQHTKYFGN